MNVYGTVTDTPLFTNHYKTTAAALAAVSYYAKIDLCAVVSARNARTVDVYGVC